MQELNECHFNTSQEAQSAIYSLAQQKGFSAVLRRQHGKRLAELGGNYVRTDFECSRGKSAISRSKGKRTTPTARCDCSWVCYVRYYKKKGSWIVKIPVDKHNHVACHGSFLPSNRRIQRQNGDLGVRFGELCKDPKLSAEAVARQLREEFPGSSVIDQDVRNRRYAQKIRNLQNSQLIREELPSSNV